MSVRGSIQKFGTLTLTHTHTHTLTRTHTHTLIHGDAHINMHTCGTTWTHINHTHVNALICTCTTQYVLTCTYYYNYIRTCITVQDTLVALEALGLFEDETFTRDLNKALTVSVPGLPAITHTITAANRYQRRDFVVSMSYMHIYIHETYSVFNTLLF